MRSLWRYGHRQIASSGSIALPSIECVLKMAEIYARVRFDERKDTPVPPVLAPGG